MTSEAEKRKERARRFNALLDGALPDPGTVKLEQLLAWLEQESLPRLAERLCRRTSLLARQTAAPDVVENRDRLLLRLYAAAAPQEWHSAWCDGSHVGGAGGIGGLILQRDGKPLCRFSENCRKTDAFSLEIKALERTVQAAIEYDIERLRVHSDCVALARMWHRSREDARLQKVHALARRLRAFGIYHIPRQHNRPAHRLAQEGARGNRNPPHPEHQQKHRPSS